MMWKAFGGLVLVLAAFGAALWIAYSKGRKDGYEAKGAEMSALRAERRAEQRARTAMRGHQLATFPDEAEFEKLATTGELRAYAETGDLGSLNRETAAFFRILSLREWTRKKEPAA